jgi:uncharacterized protein YhaN
MRFRRLTIPAFGPFTNLELSFPKEGHDLHVIYGENEAGKSSLLRAIRDLLFGIHGQSTDNFLHDYKNLRLLGEVENRAGERLIFQRRKGTKNTLLNESGNALPDSALQPFLGTVDQSYFSTMFGLGGSELRDGARQLLQGEGEIGSALFSASLGGTPVQRVLDALVAESELLFKGRATANVSIRPAANRYKDLLKQSRDSVLNPDEWDQLRVELEEKEATRQRLEEEITECERMIAWIQRCEDALPSVGRLSEEMRLLGELPELPEVASDFVEQAKEARNAVSGSNSKVEDLAAQIKQLEARLADCATSPKVMAEAAALDSLHEDLSGYRMRKESLKTLGSKLAGIEPALRAGMVGLEVDGDFASLESLRLGSAIRIACDEAAESLKAALRRHEETQGKAEGLEQAIEDQSGELRSLPDADLTPLREALAVAAEATDADKTFEVGRQAVEALIRKVAAARTLVPGVPEELEAAACIPVPALATIRKYAARFGDLKRDTDAANNRIRDEEKTIKTLRADLTRLERRGELPTEDSLTEARNRRNHGWELVLADWKGGGAKEQFDPDAPLEEAFPRAVKKADEIADGLRLHADAVAQAEEKRTQIQACQQRVVEEKEAVASLETAIQECQAAWEAEWAGSKVRPRSPEEMEEWRENWIQFKETIGELREAEATADTKREKIDKARATLAAALAESDKKSFSVLFEAARNRVQKGEQATGRRDNLSEELGKKTKELEKINRAVAKLAGVVENAKAEWERLRAEVGLPENVSPDSGRSLLEERSKLLARFDTWKELSGETGEVEKALLEYEGRVGECAAALSIHAEGTEAQEAALWKAVCDARVAQTKHDQLVAQIDSGQNDLGMARQKEVQARSALDDLLSRAKLSNAEELEPLIANLEKRTAIQGRVDDLRKTLGDLARGQAVDEFIANVSKENADELPQRRTALGSEKAGKSSELNGVRTALVELNRSRAEFEKAGDTAADYRQQAEAVAATLREDASRFIRLRMAAHFLRTQIDQFRKEHQGPLLEKSGRVFAAITRGAFDGLEAEFTEQDVPIMVGRRAGASNVPVEGMSDGTRDQLYLALRLAALERHLQEHEPMPLVLDDLLITFDNERTKAILPQLADLAKRTQIFLFTHHEHLVELCRQTLGEDQFKLHRIETGTPDRQ